MDGAELFLSVSQSGVPAGRRQSKNRRRENESGVDPPSAIVRETRAGRVVEAKPPVSASRGADFNVSHFCTNSPPVIRSLVPFVRTGENTPCSRFRGVLALFIQRMSWHDAHLAFGANEDACHRLVERARRMNTPVKTPSGNSGDP